MKRKVALFVFGPAVALLLGCSEESRKAWVSILPKESVEEASAEESAADTATSKVVPVIHEGDSTLLSDTLTVHQMPRVLVSEPIPSEWIAWIERQTFAEAND